MMMQKVDSQTHKKYIDATVYMEVLKVLRESVRGK